MVFVLLGRINLLFDLLSRLRELAILIVHWIDGLLGGVGWSARYFFERVDYMVAAFTLLKKKGRFGFVDEFKPRCFVISLELFLIYIEPQTIGVRFHLIFRNCLSRGILVELLLLVHFLFLK